MKRFLVFALIMSGVVTVASIAIRAATNETLTVTAKKKDNPQQNPGDVEGWFQNPPTLQKDEIHVTNNKVRGTGAGVYNDPTNDGALLSISQYRNPVKVDVEGREGVGAMYWVAVVPTGDDAGEEVVLWADVKDVRFGGSLVLKDKNSDRTRSDNTDGDNNTPILYCARGDGGHGEVEFWMNNEVGTYNWAIKQGGTTIRSGVLNGNSHSTASNLPVGAYVLEVTRAKDANFKRRVIFYVVGVEIDAIRLPNNFIAVPDQNTQDRIGATMHQTTRTDVEITFSIQPDEARLDSLVAVFTLRSNGQPLLEELTKLSGANQVETIVTEMTDAEFQINGPDFFDVRLVYTMGDSTEYTTDEVVVDAKRLLLELECSPGAYLQENSVCPYTHRQSPMPGSVNEWYGLLIMYQLGVDVVDLNISLSGGDVGDKALAVMNQAMTVGSTCTVKWEGYDDTICEPAGEPYCIFPNFLLTKRPAPDHVAKEGDYKWNVRVDASREGLSQIHEIKEIPLYVRYNTTDSEL